MLKYRRVERSRMNRNYRKLILLEDLAERLMRIAMEMIGGEE